FLVSLLPVSLPRAFHQCVAPLLPAFLQRSGDHRDLHSFPTRRSSDLDPPRKLRLGTDHPEPQQRTDQCHDRRYAHLRRLYRRCRSEEHTSELQSRENLVCRLLLEKKKVCASVIYAGDATMQGW